MRRSLVIAAALAAAGAGPAQAQTGGAEFVAAPKQAFSVSPASIAPGATLTIGYRTPRAFESNPR